jgi:hypothetical protein
MLKKFLYAHWPIFTLAAFVVVIAVLNYEPSTMLTGWDNLHPEYNFTENIKRSLFAVWQEYQSLGLLGGHAHSTDILRQVSLYGLSFLFPMELLRYLSTYFMLLAGTLGAYVFIRFLLSAVISRNEVTRDPTGLLPKMDYPLRGVAHARNDIAVPAFLGALFYLLNLATVQTFYAPFEAFIAHFAALPWLLWASLSYILLPSRRHTWYLILALIFALPMAYIPTLFIVYLIALGLIFLTLFLSSRHSRGARSDASSRTKNSLLQRGARLGLFIFLINAFWLLPFLYFTLTNAQVTLHSKINQMSTETIFLQNKEFGTLTDVPLLKGFWFNNTDPDREGVFRYMMEPWRSHLGNPVIAIIGYLFFIGVLYGAYESLKRKNPLLTVLTVLLFFTFTALAIATPPFSFLNAIVRNSLPILNQAFRFPFTKFSILMSLTYAALFAIAIQTFLPWLESKFSIFKIQFSIKILNFKFQIIPIVISALLILFTLPIFRGHLFYDKEQLPLPTEYRQLFMFFNSRDHSERIANFPQHTFWGWSFYSWGYGGSGFLWYGIPQPMLDRAFDVWSAPSENYYFEISQAVYQKDSEAFRQVLDKYAVTWILVDKNIIYPPSPKALFYNDLDALIAQNPSLKKEKQFGKISLYKVNRPVQPEKSVAFTNTLLNVNDYSWTGDDVAFKRLGIYRTDNENSSLFFPFRSLTTLKTAKEQEVTISETASDVFLKTALPARTHEWYLRLPPFAERERIVPIRLRTRELGRQLVVEAVVLSPEISLGENRYGGKRETITLFNITRPASGSGTTSFPYTLNLNGASTVTIPDKPNDSLITTFLSLSETNTLSLSPKTGTTRSLKIAPTQLKVLPNLTSQQFPISAGPATSLTLKFPKITDDYLSFHITPDNFSNVGNCDGFRNGTVDMQVTDNESIRSLQLSSNNATACTSYFAETLPHDLGYIMTLKGENAVGRSLHFWVENVDQRRGPIDTYLPESKGPYAVSYLLSPMETFGRSYSFHFDNIAIGQEKPVNSLSTVSLSPFPYGYASTLMLTRDPIFTHLPAQIEKPTAVSHPNKSLYVLQPTTSNKQTPAQSGQTVILYQSYDPGWKMYRIMNSELGIKGNLAIAFPFFFGQEVKDHFKVNNWANGWSFAKDQGLMTNSQSIIVYLPQYLQYFGVVLLVLTITILGILSLIERRKT